MPIRMTDDPVDPNQQDDNGGGGGSGPGGGGGLGSLLPLLLTLFRGKGIILLLVLAAGAYFLLGRGGCNTNEISKLATGGFLDPKQFEKAKIYEPLADDPNRPPLPESANLQQFAPTVGNQGEQGSCVAWSSAYGARTILEAARTGDQGERLKFSPAFLYNQIGMQNCDGSYINKAMEFMTQQGAIPYNDFQYDDQDCSRQPNDAQMNEALRYRMHGYNRLSDGDKNDVLDLHAIKENLSQGAPVVIGMMVGQSFMKPMMGKDLWEPEDGDRNMMGFGGHALCVVGYDDKKYGGAFLIMNSWGSEWGTNGFAWIRYNDFKFFAREAYGLDPMQKVGAAANHPFDCEIGLVQVQYDGTKTITGDYVPLRSTGNNRFETTSLVAIGSKFKMEVKNSTECYVYVFGKETDGTCYTLFPYPTPEDKTKTRYSPYCGITGYRLFPKDKSMTPDSIGTKDEMAVVMSTQELDWNSLSQQISQNPQSDFGARVNAALKERLTQNVRFQSTDRGTMQFSTANGTNKAVACIVEIDKK